MIYFIQCGENGPIKIGHSAYPQSRLKALQEGSPYKLRLLGIMAGDLKQEALLHSRFNGGRFRNEWFEPTSGLLNFIAEYTKKPKPLRLDILDTPPSLEERGRQWRRAKAEQIRAQNRSGG